MGQTRQSNKVLGERQLVISEAGWQRAQRPLPCPSREFTLEEASDYVMRTLKQHSEEAHVERNRGCLPLCAT